MSDIKVTTGLLWSHAQKLSERALDFSNIIGKYRSANEKMKSSCSAFRIGSFFTFENQSEARFTRLMENLTMGSRIAMNCVFAYEEANDELVKEYSNWFGDVEQNTLNGGNHEAWVEDLICKEEEYWDSLVGTHRYTEDELHTATNGNLLHNYKGECTWYAFAVFVLSHPGLHINTPPNHSNAKYWLENNKNNEDVVVIEGNSLEWFKDQKLPCIAVATDGKYGHVSIIENILYDKEGRITAIYISQCNADSNSYYNPEFDGIYQKLVPGTAAYDNYIKGLSGFICAK